MLYLLIIAVVGLLINLLYAITQLKGEYKLPARDQLSVELAKSELLSIIIPARNEVRNIKNVVESCLSLNWPNIEVILVNDHSEDETVEIALRAAGGDDRLRVVDAPYLSSEWRGMMHVLHVGVKRSRGEWLLFVDADVVMQPDVIRAAMQAMSRMKCDLLSLIPRHINRTIWEKVLQPFIFDFFITVLPPASVNNPDDNRIAANGQFMMMRRRDYDRTGECAEIKRDMPTDVNIVRLFIRNGFKYSFLNGVEYLSVRHYRSFHEIWNGWSKGFYVGLNNSIVLTMTLILVFSLLYIIPTIYLPISVISGNPLQLGVGISCCDHSCVAQDFS